jgi:hypothetical protein
MTDHWEGRPPTGRTIPAPPDATLEAALNTITAARRAAAADEQFRKTVGERLAAALVAALESTERRLSPEAVDSDASGLAADQRQAAVRLSHAVLNMSTTPPNCPEHQLRQRRDHRPPWCRDCGRDRFGVVQRPERP